MDRAPAKSASQALRRGSGILILAFFLSFLVNVLRLSGLIFMMLVYDRVLPSRSEESLVALFVLLVAFLLAHGVIDYARRRLLARFGAQFQERLEVSLFGSAKRGDLFEQGRSKPVAGLDEVDGLRSFFHSGSLIAIYDFVWTPLFLLVIFVLHPLLGWICLGGMVVILAFVLIQMLFIGTRETEAAAASRKIGDMKYMIAASRETIRSQEMSRGFRERWLTARRNSRDRAIALKDWTTVFDSFSDMTVLLGRYAVLAVGASLALQGSLSTGAMVASTFLVSRVLVRVERFMSEIPKMIAARRNWTQLEAIMAAKAKDRGEAFSEAESGSRARLSLVNVSVRSPLTSGLIIKGITLDVPPGQMIQIIGKTGSGKTVLAETIMGLWKVSGGTILINGRNLARLSDADTASLLGYVPESPGFLSGTLAENISHLDPEANEERVTAAARRACLHAFISALPLGYQTAIEPSASALPRGRRHQLALARAVYATPELLIIDEPDSTLFEVIPETMEKTIDQILKKGGSVLVFSRKRLAFKRISASYQIDDGKLKRIGSTAERKAPAKVTVVLGDKMPRERAAPEASVTPMVRS